MSKLGEWLSDSEPKSSVILPRGMDNDPNYITQKEADELSSIGRVREIEAQLNGSVPMDSHLRGQLETERDNLRGVVNSKLTAKK